MLLCLSWALASVAVKQFLHEFTFLVVIYYNLFPEGTVSHLSVNKDTTKDFWIVIVRPDNKST